MTTGKRQVGDKSKLRSKIRNPCKKIARTVKPNTPLRKRSERIMKYTESDQGDLTSCADSSDFEVTVANESGFSSEYDIDLSRQSEASSQSQTLGVGLISSSDWVDCAFEEGESERGTSDGVVGFTKMVDIDGPPIRSSVLKPSNPNQVTHARAAVLTHEFDTIDVYNGYYSSDDGETYHSRRRSTVKHGKQHTKPTQPSYQPKQRTRFEVLSDSSVAELPTRPLSAYMPTNVTSMCDFEDVDPVTSVIDPASDNSWDGAAQECKAGSSDEEITQKVVLKNYKKVKNMLIC
jgi:hypothetical protein